MSVDTERLVAIFPLIDDEGLPTQYFRDWLGRVDNFIQLAAVVSTWGGIGGNLTTQTDLQNALDAKADTGDNVSDFVNDAGYLTAYAPPSVRDEATDPYTLVIGDANTVIRLTATDADVTIPLEASVDFDVGTEISLRFTTSGTHTLDTTGLTINGTVPSLTQHLELKFRKVGVDEWDLV